MCGIAGIAGTRPASAETLERMAAVIAHRGPDDFGFYRADGISLAHRRLSIIDLSEAGHQPMSSAESGLVIVFNGEIYNYRELASQLKARGHTFASHSDTEVILHSYEEWGTGCVTHFNGMWAFALWDSKKRELFCSRDRFGEKPFYYCLQPDRLVFGSEIKAVLAAGIEALPNESYIAHVLVDAAIDDCEETCFAGIRQLPGAHSMTYSDGVLTFERYWDYDHEQVLASYDFSDPSAGLRELLEDSVRLRILASDVKVGSCLSGGMDSSSIVALASGLFNVPMGTFSVSYAEKGFDEGKYARLVAERFNCDAHRIRPTAENYFQTMASITWFQDEPSLAPGLYSQWHAMNLADGVVKVILDGQGGDELLAGYRNYLDLRLHRLLLGPLHGRLGDLSEFARDLPAAARTWELPLALAVTRAAAGEGVRDLYRRLSGTWVAGAFSGDVIREARRREPKVATRGKTGDALNDRLYDDVVRDHIPGLLHYEDRNSMAHSIEARTPFLDYRVVEYSLAVADRIKLKDGRTKALLRSAMKGVTPQEVLNREDKMGYATPIGAWYGGELACDVSEVLLSQRTLQRGLFDPRTIAGRIEAHKRGDADYSWQIYRWLSVEYWFRSFIDHRDERLGPVESEGRQVPYVR